MEKNIIKKQICNYITLRLEILASTNLPLQKHQTAPGQF